MPLNVSHTEALPRIGGIKPVTLRAQRAAPGEGPGFLEATLLPGRGMNLFQVRGRIPGLGDTDLLHSPSPGDAAKQLNGGPDDFMGVQSFSFGGALLVPFANRIRGRLLPDERTLETDIMGHAVRLPADWHGKHPGAEKCAMHGLILASKMAITEHTEDRVLATLDAKDFGGHWVSAAAVHTLAALRWDALDLAVTVQNTGQDLLPTGIGWHPYFALPSGKRDQARLRLPARRRALVNNYDDEFPTGRIEPVRGTPYDFSGPDGAALGSMYFDDCFLDLEKSNEGHTRIEISDPPAHYGMRLMARSPQIQAIQVYSPQGSGFVVVEPQFNLADPFSPVWPADVDTGMVVLAPGHSVTWAVRWELIAI